MNRSYWKENTSEIEYFPPDMHRTFPDNIQFRDSSQPCLQKALFNVLLGYGHHNKDVGYCQVGLLLTFTHALLHLNPGCTELPSVDEYLKLLLCKDISESSIITSEEVRHCCNFALFTLSIL